MAPNCNAHHSANPDEMWYFKLKSDMFSGNTIHSYIYGYVCLLLYKTSFYLQPVSKFNAAHKIHWLNVIEYGLSYIHIHICRLVMFTEDAATFICCRYFFQLNQQILIKLMPLMLPSLTDCNSTYVIHFLCLLQWHTYAFISTHSLFIFHILDSFHLLSCIFFLFDFFFVCACLLQNQN